MSEILDDAQARVIAEQEATIQRIKGYLPMWADILEEHCPPGAEVDQALCEMRQVAGQL